MNGVANPQHPVVDHLVTISGNLMESNRLLSSPAAPGLRFFTSRSLGQKVQRSIDPNFGAVIGFLAEKYLYLVGLLCCSILFHIAPTFYK